MGFASRQSQRDWEEAYEAGYDAGLRAARRDIGRDFDPRIQHAQTLKKKPKRKRKLSAWNRYVRDNKDKPRFRWKSNTATHKKGMLNLK